MNFDFDVSGQPEVSPESLERAIAPLIISTSGWRKVFAADGSAESANSTLHVDDVGLVLTIAEAFHRYLHRSENAEGSGQSDGGRESDAPRQSDGTEQSAGISAEGRGTATTRARALVLATDSRPTGPAIADIAMRLFAGRGRPVEYLGVCTIPAVIAYTAERESAGFFYISASHNPLGHNGIKFGGPDGAVLPGTEARQVAEIFHRIAETPDILRDAAEAARGVPPKLRDAIGRAVETHNSAAAAAYRRATLRIASADETPISGVPSARTEAMLAGFKRALAERPLGVLADFNGSARAASIDVEFLSALGVSISTMNATPGGVAHQIVPEGAGLEPCARRLEELHRTNPEITVGYVPDNDGDRGNILYIDEDSGAARSIHAQAVFAMACLAELLWLRASGAVDADEHGRFTGPVAVVANGPTSMRVDEIARSFAAEVHRAEVGEANVVGLARLLRSRGYTVRILGEGSNGGTITHPGVVRDPLQTLLALLKLTRFRDVAGDRPLFAEWNHRDEPASIDTAPTEGALPSISELIRSLPAYTTTGAYEERAVLHIESRDHGALKAVYEQLFQEDWKERKEALYRRYGISSWREINYEGYEAREGVGPSQRSGAQKGGLKIVFSGTTERKTEGEGGAEKDIAFMWMRGSGTEPVYRILVDAYGSDLALHDELLAWQTELVRRADTLAATGKRSPASQDRPLTSRDHAAASRDHTAAPQDTTAASKHRRRAGSEG
jgi:phosphoglucomutase